MKWQRNQDRTLSLLGAEITLDQQLNWGRELLAMLSDVIALSPVDVGPLHGSVRIQRGSMRAVLVYGDALEPGLRRSSTGLLDEQYGVHVTFPSSSEILLRVEESCAEWFSWSLQLLALRSRASFVHGACLERAGKAVLLAARNGFGKTVLAGDFLKRGGWRLLDDDLTLLTRDGMCYAYPCALESHSEWHLLPELFAQTVGPRAPRVLSSALERAGRAVKPLLRQLPVFVESARRYIPQAAGSAPTTGGSEDGVKAAAPLDVVIWLERRAGLKQPHFQPAEESLAPRILGSTINEFDPRCVRITNIALALGLFELSSIYGTWMDVLRAGLARARCYTLSVPAALPVEQMPALVHQILLAEGLGAVPQSCA